MVSVIMTAYGHADYILHALRSVFNQSFSDHEVIVINDGSPDHTEEVLRGLIDSGRIRYYKQANQGVAASRNFGISVSRGKYIALLDDDDYWPPDKLEWQVEVLENCIAPAVAGIAAFVRGDGGKVGWLEIMGDEVIRYETLFDGCPFISPGSVLIRKDAILSIGGLDRSVWGADDFDLWFGLASVGPLFRQERISLFYRHHETNASRDSIRMLLNCRDVVEKRLEIYDGEDLQLYKHRAYTFLLGWRGALCIRELAGAILKFPPGFGKVYRYTRGLIGCFGKVMMTDVALRVHFRQELVRCKRDGLDKMRSKYRRRSQDVPSNCAGKYEG